jgi:hypothetical protein
MILSHFVYLGRTSYAIKIMKWEAPTALFPFMDPIGRDWSCQEKIAHLWFDDIVDSMTSLLDSWVFTIKYGMFDSWLFSIWRIYICSINIYIWWIWDVIFMTWLFLIFMAKIFIKCRCCLVGNGGCWDDYDGISLWKIWRTVSWDDDIPN